MSARRLETDDGIPVPVKVHYGSMTCRSVWNSAAMPIGEAMNVKPITADIYADNAAL